MPCLLGLNIGLLDRDVMATLRHCSWISSFLSSLAQTAHLMTAEITDFFGRA